MLQPKGELRLVIITAALTSACSVNGLSEPPDMAPVTVPAVGVHLTEPEVRAVAELIRLEDRRDFDTLTLGAHLESEAPLIRRLAARAIGRIGDRRGTGLLLRALSDSTAVVRAEAAFALGQLGDTATSITATLADRLLAPAESPAVRVEAAAALGRLPTPEARGAIIGILESAGASKAALGSQAPPPAVVGEALLSSWRLEGDPELIGHVIALTASEDDELRWRAAYALIRMNDPAGIPALLALRGDSSPLARSLAVRGLRAATADSASLRSEALAALIEAARDPHPHVRINAMTALGGYGEDESSESISAALGDDNENVRWAAARALGQAAGPTAKTALRRVAANAEESLAVRSAALSGLLEADTTAALPIITALSRSGDWLDRLYAARSLASRLTPTGLEILERLAADPDPRVAATALNTLGEYPPEETPGIERILVEHLGSGEIGVRTAALRALASRATAAHLPILLTAWERAQSDPEHGAARAAIAALGRLAREGVPVANSFHMRFPRPDDLVLRRDLIEELGPAPWGDAAPFQTGRDLDFYEEIVRTLMAPRLAGAPAPRAVIHTGSGSITIELAPEDAPLTVHNVLNLVRGRYYDGMRWHRVVPNFVIQGGDPRGDGGGGPGYTIRDEHNRRRYLDGTVGMALAGPDTGGSQFFITHSPQPHLDGRYTIFGRVVDGMEIVEKVAQDDPIITVEAP